MKNGCSSAMLRTLLPYAKDLDIPPMVLGFKITSQKAALDSELAQAATGLPPFVETGTFNVGSQPFKSFAVTASKALPPQQQEMLKSVVAKNISDPQQADQTTQALLARRFEIAYGYVGDYFIVSLGPDHSQLQFAASYADSLLARPEVQAVAGYTGKPVLTFSWSSAELQAECRQEFQMTAIYEEVKQQVAQTFSAADVTKLEADLKRIDEEANGFMKHDFTPMVGVSYRDQGLHGEVFGGMKLNGAPPAMKFTGVPTASTFLWVDQLSNQAMNDAFRIWFEDLCATSYDTFQRAGITLIPPDKRMGIAMIQSLAVPKLVEFYKISRDQFAKSLGSENAFAMDLSGEIPDLPMLPPQFHTGGKLVRMAYLSDVRDRALLDESWKSYFKLSGDILQMTPAASAFPSGLPQPTSEVVEGTSLSYYPLPMPTGDLIPNVAVTDKTFIIGTSRSYSLELTKAALQSAPGMPNRLALDFRMNFKPAFDFANIWLAFAAQNPDLVFKGNAERRR